ncbi:unnamed protein product [Vitrella brassicaformis CCMP3155]|uniref:Uncharacterized protein n=1 Tax=Vitrella brassicaformis (strain CCMP3155) TaxID=1169540 RepID=A0A0G4G4G6_VITBC|nr:unnamed protein product [Vitrella brassicaformis CCMP3155]|eukprot:CEM22831.1 unnamed protein product [Vitrella brassicaformis CCMP3155]
MRWYEEDEKGKGLGKRWIFGQPVQCAQARAVPSQTCRVSASFGSQAIAIPSSQWKSARKPHFNDRRTTSTQWMTCSAAATLRALRLRLSAGLERSGLADVIRFADDLGGPYVAQAIWLVEKQRWDEVADALRLAGQLGFCHLPLTLRLQDLQEYTSKEAYLADARVVAQWTIVGRHVWGAGSFGLFRQGGLVRIFKNLPGYELTLSPPLPPSHPYQQHIDRDDPPVAHQLCFNGVEWAPDTKNDLFTEPSVSSFIMGTLLQTATHRMTDAGGIVGRLFRRKAGKQSHKVDALLSLLAHPHHGIPWLAGCTAICASQWRQAASCELLLTPFNSPFVAWIRIYRLDCDALFVHVMTTEAPAVDYGIFKECFPQATSMARPVLSRAAPLLFDKVHPKAGSVRDAGACSAFPEIHFFYEY